MTRVNVVPVTELTDKHLLAEYRELPRIFAAARKWLKNGGNVNDLPTSYRLGKGHMKFFYNKLLFCFNRQSELYSECLRRGFNVQHNPEEARDDFLIAPEELFNNYTPTRAALCINRERINERLQQASQRRTAKRSAPSAK